MQYKIVVHYDEIALKGGNRCLFEEALVRNLNRFLSAHGYAVRALNSWGRIFIPVVDLSVAKDICEGLKIFPGVSNFGIAISIPKDEPDDELAEFFVPKLSDTVFRVSAKRVDKSYPFTSQETERAFAEKLFSINQNLSVSMKGFDTELQIEILHSEKLYYIKEKGIGGLPSGSSGSAVSLLSAGFDSPVASYLLQKRGARVFPIHFHAREKTGKDPEIAVKDIAQILSRFQGELSVALVSVLDIQKHIAENAKDKLRIVLLRRSFMRMASLYAEQTGALSLVTGDSLGQVASQTMENIYAVDEASVLPVFRPLIGLNKSEIIDISRFIATHDISARPCEDTCAMFVPKNPETKAKLKEVIAEENKLNLSELEKNAINQMEFTRFMYGQRVD